MKTIKYGLLAGWLLFSVSSLAQNDDVLRGPVPDWAAESNAMPVPEDASGLIFIRRQDVIVHLDENGQSTFTAQHFRLLHPQALQVGNISIVWNPAAGAPIIHRLLIHRDGKTIDILQQTDFEILRREDQLEQAVLDGFLTAALRVPDLRVGDELELAFTAPGHDPTLGNKSFGLLALTDTPPPGRIRLGLTWEDGEKPFVKIPDGLADITQSLGNSINIGADNIGALAVPKDAPPRFGWQRIAEFSDFEKWSDVSKRFNGMFISAAHLDPGSQVKNEATKIASIHSGDIARAQAALEFVQRQVRYVYVGLNGGNYTPSSAETTWKRRYGDCKGKTALLLALLNELGIDAEPVLVNNSDGDDGLNERLPSPGMFDHVLVRSNIGGETFWMDSTLPDIAIADVTPVIPYRWVLPLSQRGSELEAVPQKPFALPQEMGLYEIDASAGFDEPARKISTKVTGGIEGILEYMQFSVATKEQIETAMRNALTGGTEWDEVDSVDYSYDRDARASILTIVGTGPVDWDDDGDGAFSLILPGGGFSPPGRRQRASNQDQAAPFYNAPTYSCYATTLRLPEGTKMENWGFNSVFDTMMYGRLYYRMMERRADGTIRMVRGARVEDQEIDPDRARKDNARLSDFDNSMANITYDPNRTMEPWGKLSAVPATYEIDWTSTAAPCLPDDVLADD